MSKEHQPGSPVVDLDELEREARAGLIAITDDTDSQDPVLLGLLTELRTLRARVAELERHYDAAGPEHNLLALLDLYHERAESAEARETAWDGIYQEEQRLRREAEARVKELEAGIRRALGVDVATSVAVLESELHEIEAYRRGMDQTELLRGLPLPKSLEDAIRALAKLVPVHPPPDQLDSCDSVARRAAERITDLESQLAAAKLDLERWHTSVEADRLATLLDQRDEARAEVKALTKELAAAREEADLIERVRAHVGARLLLENRGEGWFASWPARGVPYWFGQNPPHPTLPALLRAILEVEAKGG